MTAGLSSAAPNTSIFQNGGAGAPDSHLFPKRKKPSSPPRPNPPPTGGAASSSSAAPPPSVRGGGLALVFSRLPSNHLSKSSDENSGGGGANGSGGLGLCDSLVCPPAVGGPATPPTSCGWTGSYGDFIGSHLLHCQFVEETCPLGCGKTLLKCEMQTHLDVGCPNNFDRCEICGGDYPKGGKRQHDLEAMALHYEMVNERLKQVTEPPHVFQVFSSSSYTSIYAGDETRVDRVHSYG